MKSTASESADDVEFNRDQDNYIWCTPFINMVYGFYVLNGQYCNRCC